MPKLYFGWWPRTAGLITVYNDAFALHLFPTCEHWVWGREVESYDLCATYYGCGPLFLFVKMHMHKDQG